MPYIEHNREVLDAKMEGLMDAIPVLSPGEMNYVFTTLLLAWQPTTYRDMEALVGRLEMVKLEFYRRFVAPYEDLKKEQYGDVF